LKQVIASSDVFSFDRVWYVADIDLPTYREFSRLKLV